jgi:hypothetical protein
MAIDRALAKSIIAASTLSSRRRVALPATTL